MSVTFRPAVRENVPLLIGLAGGTGSGKTYSALRLATGIANGKKIVVIDTENGRARIYADEFQFDTADLTAPFRPAAYADAIIAADEAGYPVIVVDSMSHEWAGDGGMLDWQDELMGGVEAKRLSAWIVPKMEHKKFVTKGLLQRKAHIILCFRAEPKVEMRKGADGKWEIVPKPSLVGLDGWIPISEKNLPYELTASFLLMADQPGVPHPIKLPEKLRGFFPLGEPIGEAAGGALAEWAKGGKAKPAAAASEEWAADGEVAAVLELAARVSDEAHEKMTGALAKQRDEHGGKVRADWLSRQAAALRRKLPAEAVEGEEAQSRFPIPESARA